MILLQLYKSRQTQYVHWNPNLSQSQLSCPPYARTDHSHTCVLKEKLNHEIITDLPTMGRQWLPLRRPAQTGSTIATWVFGRSVAVCAKTPGETVELARADGPLGRRAPLKRGAKGRQLERWRAERRIWGGGITYWGKIPFWNHRRWS